jgi:hypothetical protein
VLSVQVAISEIVPVWVPLVGEDILTTGGTVSELVIITGTAVAVLPLESVQIALMLWLPFANVPVFSVRECCPPPVNAPAYGFPSSVNCKVLTAKLSEQVAVKVIVPVTVPPTGEDKLTTGAIRSAFSSAKIS